MADIAATKRAKELTHVVEFLNTEFPKGIDLFNHPYKGAGDVRMDTIYVSRGVTILFEGDEDLGWCEIYGLTDQEFEMIKLVFNYRVKIYNTRKEV